jgi:hypothetical protein
VIGFESGFDPADPTVFVTRRTLRLTADGGASWQAVLPPSNGNTFTFRPRRSDHGHRRLRQHRAAHPGQRRHLAGGAAAARRQRALRLSPVQRPALRSRRRVRPGLAEHRRRRQLESAQRRRRRPGDLNSIWFFDSREGMAISRRRQFGAQQRRRKTWAAAESDTYSWYRLQFLGDGSVGWLISQRGTIARSVDRGRTWTMPPSATSASLSGVTDFHFVDALHGWAVAPYGSGVGTVFSSVDGGLNWQAVASTRSTQGFYAIRFADAAHGVTVGPSGVAMITADGGTTWAPRSTGAFGQLFSVAFADASTAVAVGEGGVIVRSADAGQTWQPVASPTTRTLNSVRFVSARTATRSATRARCSSPATAARPGASCPPAPRPAWARSFSSRSRPAGSAAATAASSPPHRRPVSAAR